MGCKKMRVGNWKKEFKDEPWKGLDLSGLKCKDVKLRYKKKI